MARTARDDHSTAQVDGRKKVRGLHTSTTQECTFYRHSNPRNSTCKPRFRSLPQYSPHPSSDNPGVQYTIHTFQESPLPEAFPAFDPQVLDDCGWRIGESLLTDADRNLWVAEYRPPGSDMAPRWSVFDVSGRWLGEVTLPNRLILMDVGSDYVIGLWIGDLGVESIRLHTL